jgi:hypothetical protein
MTTASQSIASQTAEAFADKIFHPALGSVISVDLRLFRRL